MDHLYLYSCKVHRRNPPTKCSSVDWRLQKCTSIHFTTPKFHGLICGAIGLAFRTRMFQQLKMSETTALKFLHLRVIKYFLMGKYGKYGKITPITEHSGKHLLSFSPICQWTSSSLQYLSKAAANPSGQAHLLQDVSGLQSNVSRLLGRKFAHFDGGDT